MTPVEVLQRWFDAHARGDLGAARELVVDDVEVSVPGTRLRGFDAFMAWYRERVLTEGQAFGYVVEDLLGGEQHAAAVLVLTDGTRSWRQVALYRLEGDRITSIWAAEEDAPAR
jgi:hypothetical protein